MLILSLFACTGSSGAGKDSDSESADCPDGFSGADCSFCTWQSAGADCHPGQPADLFDLDAIKAMSLEDMGWTEVEDPLDGEVQRLVGDIYTPFAAVDAAGNDQDVLLRSAVAVYLPEDWPARSSGKAMVAAMHYASDVAALASVPSTIAEITGMPVLYHGEYPENWEQLGFASREDLNVASGANGLARNPCEPVDLERGQYSRVLAEVDMRVITLAQRLAGEGVLDEFALRGFSKEGRAAWLALAVDDRIVVGSPGGDPMQDMRAYVRNVIDVYGCEGVPEAGETGHGAAATLEWLDTTPAGAAWTNRYDASINRARLTQRVLLIDGDVYSAEMHDGHYYTCGAEDTFLDALVEVPWRYVRKTEVSGAGGGEAGDDTSTTVVPYLVAEALLREDDPAGWYPKVDVEEVSITDGILSVYAEVSGDPEEVSIWGSYSDDRVWNEEGQAEWTELPLEPAGDGWAGELDLTALGVEDKVIGYFIEGRNTLNVGTAAFTRKDASPIRFLQEPAAGTCDVEPEDFCAE